VTRRRGGETRTSKRRGAEWKQKKGGEVSRDNKGKNILRSGGVKREFDLTERGRQM